MSMFRRCAVAAVLALLAPVSFAGRSIAPPAIGIEVVQMRQDPTHVAIAHWMSKALFTDPSLGLPPEMAKVLMQGLDGFEVFGIANAHLDPSTESITSTDRAETRASARLRLSDGSVIAALSDEDMPASVRGVRDAMSPMMGKLLGKFGETLQLVVFRVADANGHSRLDPRGAGELTLTFDAERFHWKLPLVSLLPPRVDPDTGDTFPGDYEFSPFTGHKLVAKP